MKTGKDMAEIKSSTKYENVAHETFFDIVYIKLEYLILKPNIPYMNITCWQYSKVNHHIQYQI